jgi:DNA gyrase subunit A
MPEKIENVYIEDEMRTSYIDYAMSVIVGRALPDVRDGLKPVHRRILYAMLELGLTPDKPFKKCANVVGEVLGKYHPHGDAAVYDALVRMAQDFSLRYPLIDGQGNFGSIDGDPPAAYRYTEARLSPFAILMLEDIDKETVDFVPNFDGKLKEPTVLPSKFPNIIVNGSSGIAVGMATNIPPHNLKETIDALVFLIDNPDAEDEKLLEFIKGPDFPTGGIILGKKGIRECYLTGKGKIILRGKANIEEGAHGHKKIVITEIPYQVNKAQLVEKIAELAREKKIEGIADLRDESDRDGIRVVVELKRNVNEDVVLNLIYKFTPLETSFGVIMLALCDGEPKILTLKEMLSLYLKHREQVTRRKTEFLLKKAEERAHILEGFKIAIENIDAVINLIKKSKEPKEAKMLLIKQFSLSERQAQAILEMRLQNLTKLERDKIEEEYASLIKDIERYRSILKSKKLLMDIIKNELLEIKEKYGDERRTVILEKEPEEINVEDLIQRERINIILTESGFIKRLPVSSIRVQKKGGAGTSLFLYEGDFPKVIFTSDTHESILFFTNRGKVYCMKGFEVPEGSLQSKGKHITSILPLQKDEKIVDMISVSEWDENIYVFFITKMGMIKKTFLKEFKNSGKRGIIGIALPDEDEIVDVLRIKEGDEIIIVKSNGLGIRINSDEIRPMGRNAYGVKGIKVEGEEEVVRGTPVREGEEIVLLTSKGFGKRISPKEIRITHRGGKGIVFQKINEKTGNLTWAKSASLYDNIVIMTKEGNILKINVSNIKKLKRGASGIKLIKLKEGDFVVDASVIKKEEE